MFKQQNSTVTAYGTSLGASAVSFSLNEFVSICCLLIAAGTFVINWYYKHQHFLLALKKASADGLEDDDR